MLLDKVKLVLHSHLKSEEHFEIGWSPKFLEADDVDRAEALRCLEIRLDGLRNSNLYGDAVDTLTEVAWKLCSTDSIKAYLVLVEDQPLPKSKVRSYKGLFPYKGQIKQGDFIEQEVELDEHSSFFIGMTQLTEANRDECLSLAGYSFRSFILLSGEQRTGIYGREFLKTIVPCLDVKSTIWVNYMKLIPRICKDDLMILSCGYYDPREEYANLRLFFHREVETLAQKAVSLSIHAAPLL